MKDWFRNLRWELKEVWSTNPGALIAVFIFGALFAAIIG